MMRRRKVLFVGSFIEKAKDGSVGGQMFACSSLVNSSLSEQIDWILLDTTGKSVPPPPAYIRVVYAFVRLLKYFWLLLSKRPDSVLIFSANGFSIYEKGTMALIARFAGTRVILAPRGGPLDNEIANSRFLENFVRFVLLRVDIIICQGTYWKGFFSSLLPATQSNKCVVIPNWVDVEKYPVSSGRLDSNDPLNVLYMGWIQEDKGVLDLYKAIRMLDGGAEKVNFYFLGDGPLRPQLLAETAHLKGNFRFFFPGWVYGPQKLKYLETTDIFVLASHSEGLPNSLMESMLCQVASIATNVGAVADLILPGETGVLIEKGDVNDLARSLQCLLGNQELRKKYGRLGRERILNNHSIGTAVSRFAEIL